MVRLSRSLSVFIATLVAIAALLVDPGGRAQAAPVEPLLTDSIDAYADYDGADTCSPDEKPGARNLLDLLTAAYEGTTGYIGRACTVPITSEHQEGRAVDWMVSAETERDLAEDFIDWVLATDAFGKDHALARRLGIMYMIWDHEVWKAYDPDDGWQPYTGSNPHTDHIHISLSWDGADEETTWYTDVDKGMRLDQARFAATWQNDDRLDVFRRNTEGNLEQRKWEGVWGDWEDLGGDLESGPAAAWSSKNSLWVFAKGDDGLLQKRRYKSSSGWKPWRTTDVEISAAPGVTGGGGRLDLAVRTPAGSVEHRHWISGEGWSPWEDLGGDITAPPSLVWSTDDRLDLFVRADTGALHQKVFQSGGWGAWESLGGVLTSGPAATSFTSSEASVFVRTDRGSISYRDRGSGWSDWLELSGFHVSGPTATGLTDVRTDVFTRHTSGKLHQNVYDADGWSGWLLP